MWEIIGHFHPVLVHLPIGILLLALLFEALRRREQYAPLSSAMSVILLLGALSAVSACLTGWLMSQSGAYDRELVEKHLWLGLGVALLSALAYWLKLNRYSRVYYLVSAALLPGILLTGHWGISLSHGSNYLKPLAPEAMAKPEVELPVDIPELELAPVAETTLAGIRATGMVVMPVGQEQPFLSLNFINVTAITPDMLQKLETIQKNVIWIKLSGLHLDETGWEHLAGYENLTRLWLDHTNTTDASLAFLQPCKRLAYLNLVGTAVSDRGISTLSSMPALHDLFLHQTGVSAAALKDLKLKLPQIRIDTGNYRLPLLPTDTTFLK